MTFRIRLAFAPALLAALALAQAACSGAAAPTGTSAPTALAAATASTPVAPASGSGAAVAAVEVDRVLAHVQRLSVEIGPRATGTAAERAAAEYVAGVLRDGGYATAIEPFTFQARFDDSQVAVAGGPAVAVSIIEGSAPGSVSATLVEAGTGLPNEIAVVNLRGGIALLRRGGIPFSEKVTNARNAGAVAVIIVNNEPGAFRGTLGLSAELPVVAAAGASWDTLRAQAGGPVTVTASGGTRSTSSQNVVGRSGASCHAYLGAHYDSVPQGPGANDNASGTGTMLELARAHRTEGLCVIAFGAEEVGLFGSQAFVARHPVGSARFLLNFDMTGRLDGPMIVGDDGLTASILAILGRGAEQPLRAGTFPPFTSSDHVSFVAAGVPAVTITSGDDPAIHTARDDLANVRRESLATMLRAGDAALAGLLKTLNAQPR